MVVFIVTCNEFVPYNLPVATYRIRLHLKRKGPTGMFRHIILKGFKLMP